LLLRRLFHLGRVHGNASKDDIGVGQEVVVPGWVPPGACVGGDDGYASGVVEVDDCVAPSGSGPRAAGLQEGGWEDERRREASASRSQQEDVQFPIDVARDELRRRSRGDGCVCAGETARNTGRIDMSQIGSHMDAFSSCHEFSHPGAPAVRGSRAVRDRG
jgi:hypothetical protein